MAWNTEQTQQQLRAAALAEFAEFGPDGTTMTRIAQRAGINKERLYAYFGDKDALFEHVLTDALEVLSRDIAPEEMGSEDIGGFAARAFDYHVAHPELARLLQWEALRGGPPFNEAVRTAHYQRKVTAARRAQRDGVIDAGIDADLLVFMIIAIAAAWSSVPQLALMLTGSQADTAAELARRREAVVLAAQRLSGRPPSERPEPISSGSRVRR